MKLTEEILRSYLEELNQQFTVSFISKQFSVKEKNIIKLVNKLVRKGFVEKIDNQIYFYKKENKNEK